MKFKLKVYIGNRHRENECEQELDICFLKDVKRRNSEDNISGGLELTDKKYDYELFLKSTYRPYLYYSYSDPKTYWTNIHTSNYLDKYKYECITLDEIYLFKAQQIKAIKFMLFLMEMQHYLFFIFVWSMIFILVFLFINLI